MRTAARTAVRWFWATIVLVGCAAAQVPIAYEVSLADPAQHRLHVKIRPVETEPGITLQMPAWNALYQVRDFSQYVFNVHAKKDDGSPLAITKVEKATWKLPPTPPGAVIEYDVIANRPGPFSAEFNSEHAFLNLAQILMYSVNERQSPVTLALRDMPGDWDVATALGTAGADKVFGAANYDALVDAPLEIGEFEMLDVRDGPAEYAVAIDGDKADYDNTAIMQTVRTVTRAALEWMNDRPCDRYVFIYHFRRGSGGGMEHACSTAIDVSPETLKSNPTAFAALTAHEFFHLWNVKRIRPSGLEPIDYTREQYTRALWFSEGVDSTVQEILLFRVGLIDEPAFLRRLAEEIRTLESRPARTVQSVEESSLDAWLEKYGQYNQPTRSISYYNKGNIVGVMLDLALRDASGGTKSLRDLFRWMNMNHGRTGKTFAETDGVRAAAEALTGTDFKPFFVAYISGTEPIPYNKFLATVGLRLITKTRTIATPGFDLWFDSERMPVISTVEQGSEAEKAGLQPGDVVLEAGGVAATRNLRSQIAAMKPGEILRLRIRSGTAEREVTIKLKSAQVQDFEIANVAAPTPQQLARRKAWMRGDSEGQR